VSWKVKVKSQGRWGRHMRSSSCLRRVFWQRKAPHAYTHVLTKTAFTGAYNTRLIQNLGLCIDQDVSVYILPLDVHVKTDGAYTVHEVSGRIHGRCDGRLPPPPQKKKQNRDARPIKSTFYQSQNVP